MYYITYLQVHQLCSSSMPIQMYPKYVAFTVKHKMLKRFICVFVKKYIYIRCQQNSMYNNLG